MSIKTVGELIIWVRQRHEHLALYLAPDAKDLGSLSLGRA